MIKPSYVVMRVEDAENYLSPRMKDRLNAILRSISAGRVDDGKSEFVTALVLEPDMPEYDLAYEALNRRLTDEQDLKDLADKFGIRLDEALDKRMLEESVSSIKDACEAALDEFRKLYLQNELPPNSLDESGQKHSSDSE